jgi:hypothetical protein
MPFVPSPNLAQLEIRAQIDGQHVENRIHVDMFATPTPANLEAVAVVVWNSIADVWLGSLPVECVIHEIVATGLDAIDGAQFTYAPDLMPGLDASGAMPNNVTICSKLSSDQRGRSARGRLYWLALPRDGVEDNTVTTPRAEAILAGLNATRVAIDDAGFAWVVASYVSEGAPRPGGPVYYHVISCNFVDLTIDSQRRRLPGRGQ